MGVRQLSTFIKEYVKDGYTPVSIIEECRKFYQDQGRKPEIVIDILRILSHIANYDPDKNEVDEKLANHEFMCGGRYLKYRKTCEILFKKLSSVADLVFYEDGSVRPEKLESYIKKKNEKYIEMIDFIDLVNDGIELTKIVESFNPTNKIKKRRKFPRNTTHLWIIEEIAKKYGKFFITRTRECDAEIVKYANKNESFAVLAEDSDYLIFDGCWRYFSLEALNIFDLSTMEYNKEALWDTLDLKNSYKMSLLATLNGNDFTSLDDHKKSHSTQKNEWKNPQKRFPVIAEFIKTKLNGQGKGKVIEIIAGQFTTDVRTKAREKVKHSIEMYRTNFKLKVPSDEIEEFCIETWNEFVYTIHTKSVKKFNNCYIDLRYTNPHEVEMELYKKQAGIVLKHNNDDIKLEVIAKVAHESDYETISNLVPDKPGFDLPPLIELLSSDEKYKNHEEIRFKLLKWMIDVGKDVIDQIPTEYVHDILTLNLMQKRGFIKPFEADLFLLSLKTRLDNNHDKLLDIIPKVLNKRTFQLQFLIIKFHKLISKSFNVCGLSKRFKNLDFDGVIFHNVYLKYPTESENPAVIKLLGDLVPYRLYA